MTGPRLGARILLDNLPAWLDDEIDGTNHLTIGDWGCGQGDTVDALRSHFPLSRVRGIDRSHEALHQARLKFGAEYFIDHDVLAAPLPMTFDVLAASNGLREVDSPWPVLGKLGVHAGRHLLILVPFGGAFDHSTIATHIHPDFTLSSCRTVECPDQGRLILLVYSRAHCFPHGRTEFDGNASISVESESPKSPAVSPPDLLSREVELSNALLHSRDAELRSLKGWHATLQSEAKYWQAQLTTLGGQVERQQSATASRRTALRVLEVELSRLTAAEKKLSLQNQRLQTEANSCAYESVVLHRKVDELKGSLSWKVTAPLRFLARPLFRGQPEKPAPAEVLQPAPLPVEEAAAVPAAPPAPIDPIEAVILPELRKARSIAIVQCAIPFSSALNQRPISYARYLADHGTTVLFAEVWRCPEADIHEAGEEVYPGVFTIPFYPFADNIAHTFEDNVDRIAEASLGKNSLYFCTLPSGQLKDMVPPLRARGYHIHYDVMDDWEEFLRGGEGHWYSVAVERDLLLVADSVTGVSDGLAEKFQRLRPDLVVVRNGYQPSALACEQFVAARLPLQLPKVVGYFGHFSDAWFDWDTVFYAAQQRPDFEFELIGHGLSDQSRERMAAFPNVRFVGLVPQNRLHRYAKHWWAAMIPFRPSAVSTAVDPLKIYEYLHLGLPSVVTGISGIAHYPLVYYVEDRRSFVSAFDQIPDRPGEQSLQAVAEFLKPCEWEARLAAIDRVISRTAREQHA